MPAFTVFALGTGQKFDAKNPHSKSNANLNAALYNACQLKSEHALIIDGPTKFTPSQAEVEVERNALRIVEEFRKKATQNGEGKYVLNLSGFSRGSVTCIAVANRLQEMINEEKLRLEDGTVIHADGLIVNLSLDDPVAGLGSKGRKDYRTLPPIVKQVIITLQEDEGRRGFKPQDLSYLRIQDPKQTHVTFLPFFGNHNAAMKTKFKHPEVSDCPKINHSLKKRFMARCETAFDLLDSTKDLSDDALLKCYTEAKDHRKDYKQRAFAFKRKGLADIPTPLKARSFNHHLEDYVRDAHFFVNQHHRELMKTIYPEIFNWSFENGLGGGDRIEIFRRAAPELVRMERAHPLLFTQLIASGLVEKNQAGAWQLPFNAHGENRIEQCRLMKFLKGEIVPEKTALEQLEDAVMHAVYAYNRDKSNWESFSERIEDKHSIAMKVHIRRLVNGNDTEEKKQQAVLAYLASETEALLASNSKSRWVESLKKLLEPYGYQFTVN